MRSDTRAVLADLRRRLEACYGPRLVSLVLYGSQAREDADDSSDLDVLVVLEGPVDAEAEIARTEPEVAEVSLAHGVVVACVFVSEDQFRSERSPLLINVRREGVAV